MFVSYAQNYEDVALWRALQRVENGFYVDLGAQHPVTHNVSKAFYERGWRGIHVEPVPTYASLLRDDRPEDTVVEKAVADVRSRMSLHVLPDSGLSTLDQASAARGEKMLERSATTIEVEVVLLNDILALRGDKPIHWMKIDIEGSEKVALMGWDAQKYRPWIVVVEATLPNSQIPSHQDWEPILLEADYVFAYFDGLNRFYVARERSELIDPLQRPPSVFDEFVPHQVKLLEARVDALTGLLTGLLSEKGHRIADIGRRIEAASGLQSAASGAAHVPEAHARPAASGSSGEATDLAAALAENRALLQKLTEVAALLQPHRDDVPAQSHALSGILPAPLRKLLTAVQVLLWQPGRFWNLVRRNLGQGPPPGSSPK